MLNMNRYTEGTGLFKYGMNLDLGNIALNRYQGGELRGKLSLLTLSSAGTGHWPFSILDLNFLTGIRSAWRLTVLGFTVGLHKVHNLDESGLIQGPDKNQIYFFFSGLNHKDKQLKEIINNE